MRGTVLERPRLPVRLAPKADRIVKILRARRGMDRKLPTTRTELEDYCDLITGGELGPTALHLLAHMVELRLTTLKLKETLP